MKKITLATLKSFVKNNENNLFIRQKMSFDGMVDGCTSDCDQGFKGAIKDNQYGKYNLGYKGIWIVGGSRNWYRHYEDGQFVGIEVLNCCGRSIIAIKKSLINQAAA